MIGGGSRNSGARTRLPSWALFRCGLIAAAGGVLLALAGDAADSGISRRAADSCAAKIKVLEAHEALPAAGKKPVQTRFTEQEINSYLAVYLRPKYNPSLKDLRLTFQEARLLSAAKIDFDQLNSSQLLARLLAGMLSGIHDLSLRGQVVAKGGKGHFVVEEARFDGRALPQFMVEQIITSVGRRQKPPFDPLQPSELPYGIQSVDMHPGYIVVHQ